MLFVLPMVYCVCTGRLILRVRMYRAFTVMPEPKVTWNKITRGRRSIGMHVTGEEREKRKRYFTERWHTTRHHCLVDFRYCSPACLAEIDSHR